MDNAMADEGKDGKASNEPKWRYDVFLSFKGKDTRLTFTGNLYNALRNNRFRTFMDDGGLKSGDQIADTAIKAIQDSRIAIVVLSQNYASSSWSLDELSRILYYREVNNQLVCPIFYHVDPSDVKDQKGCYGDSMARLEDKFRTSPERVLGWKSALTQVSKLSGRVFPSGYQYEYELIQDIVKWVTAESLPRFDVFLSFSKVDTRYSFTGYLCNTLRQARFRTFMNDEALEEGEDQISFSLINALEKSRLSIIVFSENYAYSSSCLDQLVMILDCMETKNQLIWPIFYKVEPSDLRHQRNSYGKAMAAHEITFGKDSEKVHKWRSALSQVANLKGWHFKAGYEYEFIERIVENAISI